ncbi:MAG: hypothetical protein LKI35_01190 [Lachnospiraceae bacterium]|jgi:hypothetical protein|nr:hypothetical protein [Lachnospiraceae bacterium]
MLWLDESYNQICFNYEQWWGNKPVDEKTAALLQESGELVRKGRRKV